VTTVARKDPLGTASARRSQLDMPRGPCVHPVDRGPTLARSLWQPWSG
jgi:hypothetical protein